MMIVVVAGDWRSHAGRGVIAALFGVAASHRAHRTLVLARRNGRGAA